MREQCRTKSGRMQFSRPRRNSSARAVLWRPGAPSARSGRPAATSQAVAEARHHRSSHDDAHRSASPADRRRPAGPRCDLQRVRGLGDRAGPHPLPASGRGADRGRHGVERDPVHPHRLGQVPGRGGRPLLRARQRPAQLLHRADQGAGEREVLRPDRHLRRGQRRHDDRRRQRQREGADHLLHGRDPGLDRAAGRRRRRRRPGRDGRVPLLRGPGPGLGLAGAAHRAAQGAVHPDVRHPRRRHPVPGGSDQKDGLADRRRQERRAPRSAGLRLQPPAAARSPGRTAHH